MNSEYDFKLLFGKMHFILVFIYFYYLDYFILQSFLRHEIYFIDVYILPLNFLFSKGYKIDQFTCIFIIYALFPTIDHQNCKKFYLIF